MTDCKLCGRTLNTRDTDGSQPIMRFAQSQQASSSKEKTVTEQLEAAPGGIIRVYDENWFLILTRNIELGENVPRAADKAFLEAHQYPVTPSHVTANYNGRREMWHASGRELEPYIDFPHNLLNWPTP